MNEGNQPVTRALARSRSLTPQVTQLITRSLPLPLTLNAHHTTHSLDSSPTPQITHFLYHFLIRPLTHFISRSLIYQTAHFVIQSLGHSSSSHQITHSINLLVCSLCHTLNNLVAHSVTRSLTQSLARSFKKSFLPPLLAYVQTLSVNFPSMNRCRGIFGQSIFLKPQKYVHGVHSFWKRAVDSDIY